MRVTAVLIGANLAVFLLGQGAAEALIASFALWPVGRYAIPGLAEPVGFAPWQLVTSAFLHGNATHLALNMFALYMFGRDVERLLGPKRYSVLYAAAVLTASVAQLAVVTLSGTVYPTVGASGGVYGILLAFGLLFPERIVVPLFPPIPMRARTFVLVYGGIELAHGVLGTASGVAHFAHLGGMLGAWLLLLRWRRRALVRRAPPRGPFDSP
jgi:membrane associated rhomboid family serine protease